MAAGIGRRQKGKEVSVLGMASGRSPLATLPQQEHVAYPQGFKMNSALLLKQIIVNLELSILYACIFQMDLFLQKRRFCEKVASGNCTSSRVSLIPVVRAAAHTSPQLLKYSS